MVRWNSLLVLGPLLGCTSLWSTSLPKQPTVEPPTVQIVLQCAGFSAEELEREAVSPVEHEVGKLPHVERIASAVHPEEARLRVTFTMDTDPIAAQGALVRALSEAETKLSPCSTSVMAEQLPSDR